MIQRLLLIAIVALTATHNAAVAQIPDDIRKHFDEHVVGHWVAETTWGNQKIEGQSSTAWDESGMAVRSVLNGVDSKGPLKATEMQGWDAASSEVVVVGFDSRGNGWTIRYNRANSNSTTDWVGKAIGTYDGKPWESATKLHCEKDQWRYEDVTDGKPWVTIGKRKSTSSSDQPHSAWLKYLEGTWQFDLGDGRVGEATWKAVGNTPALSLQGKEQDFSITGVIGWHADIGVLVETDFYTDRGGLQGHVDREFTIIGRDSLKGINKFWNTKEGAGYQTLEYRRVNDDEMTLTGSGGSGSDWAVKFKRVK